MTKNEFLKFLREDAPRGDITSSAVLQQSPKTGYAEIISKTSGVFSGQEILHSIRSIYPQIVIQKCLASGTHLRKGDVIVKLKGPLSKLLLIERVLLNLLQRMSGIATLTNLFVKKIGNKKIILLDTRKTTPGLRDLEKAAVRHGGGHNHRRDLSSAYLVKENHIRAAGGLSKALSLILKCRKTQHNKLDLIVEVTDLKELQETLPFLPQVILLDNMSIKQIKSAVKIRNHFLKVNGFPPSSPRIQLEISGGVNLKNIREFAKTGVDRISVGGLTHSAPALDLSMLIK